MAASLGWVLCCSLAWLGEGDPVVVWSELTEPARGVLQTAHALRSAERDIAFEHVEVESLLERVRRDPSFDVLVGYPTPLIARVATLHPMAELHLPTAEHALSAVGYAPLFFDPLAIAVPAGVISVTGDWSYDPVGLSGAEFHGALVLERATPWNATGALLTALVEQAGGTASAREWLAGLDANAVQPYRPTRASVFTRVIDGEDGAVGLVTERSGRFLAAREEGLTIRSLNGAPHGLVLSAAVAPDAGDAAASVVQALSDPKVVARIAILEQLVPLSPAIADTDLPEWMVAVRAALTADPVRVVREVEQAAEVVSYFEDQVAGEFERRSQRFSQYYDVIATVGILAFVIWIVRRPGSDESDESPA